MVLDKEEEDLLEAAGHVASEAPRLNGANANTNSSLTPGIDDEDERLRVSTLLISSWWCMRSSSVV